MDWCWPGALKAPLRLALVRLAIWFFGLFWRVIGFFPGFGSCPCLICYVTLQTCGEKGLSAAGPLFNSNVFFCRIFGYCFLIFVFLVVLFKGSKVINTSSNIRDLSIIIVLGSIIFPKPTFIIISSTLLDTRPSTTPGLKQLAKAGYAAP